MPIKRTYAPSASSVGQAAFQGGLGQFSQWLRQQQLRELQVALQENARQEAMQFEAQQAAQNRGFSLQRQREGIGADLLMREMDARRRAGEVGAEREFRREERKGAEDFRREERISEEAFRKAADLSDFERAKEMSRLNSDAIGARMREDDQRTRVAIAKQGLANRTHVLDPTVEKTVATTRAERGTWLAAIAKGEIPQKEGMAKISELDQRIDDLIDSGVRQLGPHEMPKSMAQRAQEETAPVLDPDGNQIGEQSYDRNGTLRKVFYPPHVIEAMQRKRTPPGQIFPEFKPDLEKFIDKRFDAWEGEDPGSRPPNEDESARIRAKAELDYRARYPEKFQQQGAPQPPPALAAQQGNIMEQLQAAGQFGPQPAMVPEQAPMPQAAPELAGQQAGQIPQLPPEVAQELKTLPIPVLQQALASAQRVGNQAVVGAISDELSNRAPVSRTKFMEMLDALWPLAGQNWGSWNSDEFQAQLSQATEPIADQLRLWPENDLDALSKDLGQRAGLFRHGTSDKVKWQSLRKVVQPLIDQEKLRRGPPGTANVLGDPTLPRFPVVANSETPWDKGIKARQPWLTEDGEVMVWMESGGKRVVRPAPDAAYRK